MPFTFLRTLCTVLMLSTLTEPVLAAQAGQNAGWMSVLPPLVAIGLALLLRQVIPALFVGIWIGAWALSGFTLVGAGSATLRTVDTYVFKAVTDPDHASVMLFTILVGGMVGVISKNGGMLGIVDRIVVLASNAQRAMASTVALGLAIFFDDYANTLIVGNTMRPITDRMNISREKLAYLVDSTAAPIACIALVTTWVGYEVGLIRDAMASIEGLDLNAYLVFLNSIAYSFYPILALVMVFAVVVSGRDFGPMHRAEQRARAGQVAPPTTATALASNDLQDVEAIPNRPRRALNAVIPILTLVFGVVGGMFTTGEGETLREIVGSSDPYKALIWGSLIGCLMAIALSVSQGILSLAESVAAWFSGARSMLLAIMILILAWGLSGVTDQLGTASYLESLLSDQLHPGLMPALVFVLAAATAFATGSSWGTMGILLPLMVPLTWALMVSAGLGDAGNLSVLYATVAAVMGGAVWGDHCSPISDTTILSSMASQCDHIEHVRTQLPYALLSGGAALLLGAIPAGMGVPWWLCMPVGAAVLIGALWVLGKTVGTDDSYVNESN
ncbi:MAG: Na+/H+ antiporter NhaC family protein [Pseudomonadota bacterium]